ncbi:MAG: PQQ-binding-like beta-propeller repeat protein [Candidatus Bathyarchaeia archaeon]
MRLNQAFAVLLAFSIVASVVLATSSVNAQVGSKETFCVISVTPNPAGVGQTVYIIGGITDQTAWPQPGWKNLKAVIERPDGKVDTLTFDTFTTGIGGVTYTPNIPGTYKIHIEFPEQICEVTVAGTPAGTIMKASKSRVVELVVREEPAPSHPGFPRPQEYWTRPIDPQLREWAYVAGNWLNIQTYTRIAPFNEDAPEAPHVLWSKVLDDGGLIGGIVGGSLADYLYGDEYAICSYEHGDAYEGKWINPVVINGILYYNLYPPQDTGTARGLDPGAKVIEQKVVAVDIHTGQELWRRTLGDNERLSFGQIMYWDTMNMVGAFAYLWTIVGATYNAYDPLTGRYEFSIGNVPTGTRVAGPKGEILIYTVSVTGGWMTLWNSTKAVYQSLLDYYTPIYGAATIYYANRWRPHGATIDGRKGYEWNVTIPRFAAALGMTVKTVIPFDTVLLANTGLFTRQTRPVFAAISVKPGEIGRLKFNFSWIPFPDAWLDVPGSRPIDPENRVFIIAEKQTRKYYAFDLDTGRKLWGPQDYEEPDFHSYSIIYFAPWGQSVCAYGKLFTGGYGGEINAYDIKTGKHLWSYTVTDPYNEFTWGNWPTPIYLVADGKIYIGHQEHSGNPPLPRGAPFICLDAETGEEVFRVDGLVRSTRWGGQPIIADSIILWFDTYSNMIFAIGKGPTRTTVTAPDVGVPVGSTIVIRGTVMDVSPGTNDPRIALRFPGGVPAVADECMGDWMLYVYKQFPRPTGNMKGVWVKLDAVNVYTGEYIDIGGTHTDPWSGMFTVSWQPPKEGLWWIIASFPGSKSYWPSCAQTSIAVTPPTPTPTPATPEQVQTVQTTIEAITPLITALMVLVVIAIIVGVYSVYSIRKLKLK